MGKVYLVGAGPGDPGLLTLRGKSILERAEVVIYDSLVDPSVLSLCPADCVLEFVGKRGGQASWSQEDINALMAGYATRYGTVVRLKGGDPLVFGRAGEETEYLSERGLPFEVVPGVSSVTAAPGAAGVPITHRETNHAFRVLTGSLGNGESLDYGELGKTEDTLIFLMGFSKLREIADGLIKAGMDPNTPAAVVCAATTPNEAYTAAPLGSIAERSVTSNLKAPGVVIVGKSVGRLVKPAAARKPLEGRRILLLRPKEQAWALMERFASLGALPMSMPAINIEANPQGLKRLGEEIERGLNYDMIVFTSANGVRFFFKEFLSTEGFDARDLKGIRFAAIGPATAKELKRNGLKADVVPDKYNSRALFRGLSQTLKPGDKVLLPRSGDADDFLRKSLESLCEVTEIGVYNSRPLVLGNGLVQRLLEEGLDAVVFMSRSEVESFAENCPPENLGGAVCFSIGPATTKALRKKGFGSILEAQVSTGFGIAQSVEEYFRKDRNNASDKT